MSRSKKPKTSPEQLARVKAWEAANPERAQARKDRWAQSPAGKAWLVKNQAKKNKARDKWRAKKIKEARALERLTKKKNAKPGASNVRDEPHLGSQKPSK